MKTKHAEYIVDIHSHILPGIDDGSTEMDETMHMLSIAAGEGITHIIATPHYREGRRNASPQQVKSLLEAVQEEADWWNIPIQIYQGNEIYYFHEFSMAIEEGRVVPMPSGDYVLVEFSPSEQFQSMYNAVNHIFNSGYHPVIAHAERYHCLVNDPANVGSLRTMGAEIQINASAVIGEHGRGIRTFAHKLLRSKMVDYIGTDAHRSNRRTPHISECRKLLYQKYDENYVNAILYGNAMERLL